MNNENDKPVGLQRTVQLKFRVTESEREEIYERMRLLKINNLAAYMRAIAISGKIVFADNSGIKAVAAEMQKIGVNINQIARRVNSISKIYDQDFQTIKQGVDDIWRLLRSSLSKER